MGGTGKARKGRGGGKKDGPGYYTDEAGEKRAVDKTYVETPPEVIDFIARSVKHILREEFGVEDGLNAPGVTIVDPAAGTGQFYNRMADKGMLRPGPAGADLHAIELSKERFAEMVRNFKERGLDVNCVNADTMFMERLPRREDGTKGPPNKDGGRQEGGLPE